MKRVQNEPMKSLLQKAYPHFPVFLQNLGISAYGYAYRRERFGPAFAPAVSAFQARDRWEPDRMQDFIATRLREVLGQAFHAPYYRDRWAAHGVSEADLHELTPSTLHRLPTVAKEDLRKAPMAFVPDRGIPNRQLLRYFSSGSTGTPIQAICTAAGQQRFAAAREVRSYGWAGTSIRRPRAMIGGQPIIAAGRSRPPFYRYNFAERQIYLSAYHLSAATVGDYVSGLNQRQPECFTGYAFSQFQLARLMLEQGLGFDFRLAAAITSSEPLTAPMRQTILDAWGCRAYQEYGSVENCALATECEAGSMHVSPDFGLVEIVDEAGNPVAAGVEGRLVCTALLNEAQFLVRYEVGDTGAWSSESCPCGRAHLPVLASLSGRVEDAVISPDGRELVRFHGIFIGVPHVLQGQVVQEATHRFEVRVLSDRGFGPAERSEIERRMLERLGNVSVSVRQVDELERNARGKVRAVIRREPPSAAASTSD